MFRLFSRKKENSYLKTAEIFKINNINTTTYLCILVCRYMLKHTNPWIVPQIKTFLKLVFKLLRKL